MNTLLDGAAGQAENLIKDSDTQSFRVDVVEASQTIPVLVDFWAEWCEPCKTLTPLLEKVVTAAAGAVKLVKVNVDENQELAAQLKIQSLPTVMAFKGGKPVDGFAGALAESEIKNFIAKLGGEPNTPQVADFIAKGNELLDAGEVEPAIQLFTQIVQGEPDNLDAIGGLARAFIKAGKEEEAKEVMKTITEENKSHPALAPAFAALELSAGAADSGEIEALRKALAQKPKNKKAQYDLAEALSGTPDKQEAADILLALVTQDRAWNDEAARKLLVKMFEAAGPTDPFTIENRRQLSSILFS